MKKLSKTRQKVIKLLQDLDSRYYGLFEAISKIENKTDRSFVRQCLFESQMQLDDAVTWTEHRRN